MALYTVRVAVELPLVVEAEDEDEAWDIARDEWLGALRDEVGHKPHIYVSKTILTAKDLPEGWDPMCLPYGGDGNTRLKDLLPVSD
ncbi:hypothetical protein [Bordetella hinzii]|uniref:hypothetical protein n=1 Tax=Bordetella hinzii TaxID=103855 RepID=UPI0039FDAD6D